MFIFSRVGQYPEKYRDEQRIFKLHEHRILFLFGLLIAFIFIPLIGSDYLFNAILIPYLVLHSAGWDSIFYRLYRTVVFRFSCFYGCRCVCNI
jgi:hypothetical protein